jgi:hypothetical protein
LSYDAEVILGEGFDPNNYYQSTATILDIDEAAWEKLFGVTDDEWDKNQIDDVTREESPCEGLYLESSAGETLYMSGGEGIYGDSDMKYIYVVFDGNRYSPYYNLDLWSLDSDLEFESREDNWEDIKDKLAGLGVDVQDARIMSEYSIDLENCIKQEKVMLEGENISEEEMKPEWSLGDEGYYYFVEQVSQGLPICRDQKFGDYLKDEDRVALKMYVKSSGIAYMDMKYWFQIQMSEDKTTFAALDEIMETIDAKYKNTSLSDPLIVRRMELMAYPLMTGDDQYTVIPVWICTIAMQGTSLEGDAYEQNMILPVNAITGEEMFEMEL